MREFWRQWFMSPGDVIFRPPASPTSSRAPPTQGRRVLFKDSAAASEFPLAHPEAKSIAHDLDAQLKKWGLGELTITDIFRDASFYLDARWSWHFCGSAWDMRIRDYSDTDRARILGWLQGRCFRGDIKVDIVDEADAPRGPHIHVEVEDWDWRRKWEQAQRAKGTS